MTILMQAVVAFQPEWAENGTPHGISDNASSTRTAEASNMSFVTTPAHPLGNARVIRLDLATNKANLVYVAGGTTAASYTYEGGYVQFLFQHNGDSLRNATARIARLPSFDLFITTAGLLELRTTAGAVVGVGTSALAADTWYLIDLFARTAASGAPHQVLRHGDMSAYSAGSSVTMTLDLNVAYPVSYSIPTAPTIILSETTNRTSGGATPYFYYANFTYGVTSGLALPGLIRFIHMDMDGDGALTAMTGTYADWDDTVSGAPDGATTYQSTTSTTAVKDVSTLEAVASGSPASPVPGASDYVHGLVLISTHRISVAAKGYQGTALGAIHDGTTYSNAGAAADVFTTGGWRYSAWFFSYDAGTTQWTSTTLGTAQIGIEGTVSNASTSLDVTAVTAMIPWSDVDETITALPTVPVSAALLAQSKRMAVQPAPMTFIPRRPFIGLFAAAAPPVTPNRRRWAAHV